MDRARREFVAPLFAALGWDMDDRRDRPGARRDVVHEYANKAGQPVRAPDFGFCVDGARAFFVSVRKPHEGEAQRSPAAAYQLRRFAWSAQLPLSIVTDFAEFAVYDCRQRPARGDEAHVARIHHLTCEQYLDEWDEVISIFSRDSVRDGRLAGHIAALGKGRGAVTVDEAFVGDIELWRAQLARAVVENHPGISETALSEVVQRTIDRIIFLRMAEDRGMEPYGQLLDVIRHADVSRELARLYRRARARYHSELFADGPEKIPAKKSATYEPAVGVRALKSVIEALYYPDSPYQFSVLRTEILGDVYEQFLGEIIRIRDGAVTSENEAGLRKASGVYYTPGHIVDHVVHGTLGEALAGKTLGQVAGLRVLDPACGSGSFLVRAYQYLLTWYIEQYLSSPSAGHRGRLYQTAGGDWRLTIDERKRILGRHIYGVDIDRPAVEVTRRALLLEVFEGANDLLLTGQLPLFHEPALPDLHDNIKCGNSLVESDFFDRHDAAELDEHGRSSLKAFDWSDAFPGPAGFDVVIGNPPWGQKDIVEAQPVRDYVRARYPSSVGIFDLFRPFVERGVELLRPHGLFGMVLPDIVLLKNYQKTRQLLLDSLTIAAIDWWAMPFANVVIDATTIVGQKTPCPDEHQVDVRVRDPNAPLRHQIPQADFRDNPRCVFNLYLTPRRRAVVTRLSSWPVLGDYFEVHEGVHSGNMRSELFVGERVDDSCRPLHFGRDEIVPYGLVWRGRYIRLAAAALKGQDRAGETGKKYYANLGRSEWFARSKLLLRRTGDRVLAARDDTGYHASNNFFVAFAMQKSPVDLDGLCALLNSRFLTWYFRTVEPRQGRVFAELKIKHVNAFPLPRLIGTTGEPEALSQLNRLGQQRRMAASELIRAESDDDQGRCRRRCAALDGQIDALVCQLYELSPEEIALLP